MITKRTLIITKQSFFLFGPRGSGKTAWLKEVVYHCFCKLGWKEIPFTAPQALKFSTAFIYSSDTLKVRAVLLKVIQCCLKPL